MDISKLSPMANSLISFLEEEEKPQEPGKISVNPLISKFASWYERLRNAMDYREEEVVLRAAIERILKRRLLLGGSGKTIASALIRELVWAGYFPDESLAESVIERVEKRIDLYLTLKNAVLKKHTISELTLNEWIYQLLSSDIEKMLDKNKIKEAMTGFMFQIMKKQIVIEDDSEQNKDIQVFIAVRKSFARDDLAFIRFHLFTQYFGEVTEESVDTIVEHFIEGYNEIQSQLHYPRKEKILRYVKSKTAVFFILEDLFRSYKGGIRNLVQSNEELSKAVLAACDIRYKSIASKVRRAIVRSVIFVLITKTFFAFSIEGTIESLVYGRVIWSSMLINVSTPPILMVIVGLLIRPPGLNNSQSILGYIQALLFEENPMVGNTLIFRKNPEKSNPVMNFIFTLLWLLAFILSFGLVVFLLIKIELNPISQGIFIFFLTIVSFLSYRIWLMSRVYTVEAKAGLIAPIIDFLFMPIIQVGRRLTEGISQVNIVLFVFDFLIETPFKICCSSPIGLTAEETSLWSVFGKCCAALSIGGAAGSGAFGGCTFISSR